MIWYTAIHCNLIGTITDSFPLKKQLIAKTQQLQFQPKTIPKTLAAHNFFAINTVELVNPDSIWHAESIRIMKRYSLPEDTLFILDSERNHFCG